MVNVLLRALALTALVVCGLPSISGAAESECSEYDEVYYAKPGGYTLKRIEIEKLNSQNKSTTSIPNSVPARSTQGTRTYIVKGPDFAKEGPWNTDVYVFGNSAKQVSLKIVFHDHGNGGVAAKWLNEKLIFFSVWWGRIASTDLILDVDASKWLYMEDANYGNLVMSCEEKKKR